MGNNTKEKTNKKGIKRAQLTAAVLLVFLTAAVFIVTSRRFKSSSEETAPAEAVTPVSESVKTEMSVSKTADNPVKKEKEKKEKEVIETASDEIIINELMSFNTWFLMPRQKNADEDPNFYDWVELKNISDHEINLSDYFISDSKKDFYKYNLPNKKLKAGGLYVVWCRSNVFSIGNRETIYLIDKDGEMQDVMDASDILYSCSRGRIEGKEGLYLFTEPTPGKENGTEGFTERSAAPVLIGKDGVFNDVKSVTFELSSDGDIYYTTDGSVPTADSTKYKGPVTVTETSVIRAATIEKGKITSETLDLSFIMNENHTLPVTSLVVSPSDFSDSQTGLYHHPEKEIERECSVRLLDGENGFYKKTGVKLNGATSKFAQPKKSLKLKFRDVYDGNLNYDVFDSGITSYDSLILRSAQELHVSTQIRDIFFQQLARNCYENMPIQDYKFTVLYINGEYWGIYAYREVHSAKHFADFSDYKKSDVDLFEGDWPIDCEFENIYKLAMNSDIKSDEIYSQVAEHIDIDGFITWALIEGYSGNEDIEPHNVKFYYTKSDAKLHFAMVDIDLGGDSRSHMPVELWYRYGLLFNRLLLNETFKNRLLELASSYLRGPLSDENVFALRDSLAAEIRSEIPRDAQRWQYKVSDWEEDVGEILVINLNKGKCSSNFALTMKYWLNIRTEDFVKYFDGIAKLD